MNNAAGTACQRDTTYGIIYDATSHTVTGLARTCLTPVKRLVGRGSVSMECWIWS